MQIFRTGSLFAQDHGAPQGTECQSSPNRRQRLLRQWLDLRQMSSALAESTLEFWASVLQAS